MKKTQVIILAMFLFSSTLLIQSAQGFTNESYNYSITPPSGWGKDTSNTSPNFVMFGGPALHVNMAVSVSKPSVSTFSDVISLEKNVMAVMGESIVSEGYCTIGGLPFYEIHTTSTTAGLNYEQKEVFTFELGYCYVIAYSAIDVDYNTYLPAFEQSLKTFHLPNSTNAETNSPISGFIIGLIIGIIIWIIVVAYFLWRRKTRKEKLQLERAKAVETIASQADSVTAHKVSNEPRFCINCGAENEIDTEFCNKCGKRVAGE
jgi:hypothetical protein